jgi:hypothetical protein
MAGRSLGEDRTHDHSSFHAAHFMNPPPPMKGSADCYAHQRILGPALTGHAAVAHRQSGTMIVPRTVTAIINGETGENEGVDAHGGTHLTDEDRHFIHEQARSRAGSAPAEEPKFFDSVGLAD